MKLPSFQQQQGTSMGSAMTSPAQIGQIKQRTPETKRLGVTRDVQGISNLGQQKTRNTLAMVNLVANMAEAGIRIKSADETMSANAAIGEYNNRMAVWQTNAKVTANELDKTTGLRRWETLEEDRQRESKALKAELRDKYKFSMRDAEASWSIKTSAADTQYQTDVAVFSNKKMTERAGATYQVAMAGATTLPEAQGLTVDAVNAGIIDEGTGIINMDNWQVAKTFDTYNNNIPASNFDQLQKLSIAAEAGENEFARMTPAQRNTIEANALQQTKSLHMSLMDVAFQNNGISGAREYLKKLTEGGTDVSYAGNDLKHQSVVAAVGTQLSHLERVNKEIDAEQVSSVSLAPLFTEQPDMKALGDLSMQRGSPDYKDSMETLNAQLVQAYSDDPDNFLANVYPLAAKLAYVGDMPKAVTNALELALKSQDPAKMQDAIRLMTGIEDQFKGAFKAVPEPLRFRAKLLEYRMRSDNIQPDDTGAISKINQDILKIQNMGPDEKSERNSRATANLAAIKKETGLEEYITAQAVKRGDIAEGEDITFMADILARYESDYKQGFMFTENADFAGDSSYDNFRRTIGIVDVDGDLTTELNPPEVVIPRTEGWSQADQRKYLNGERTKYIAKYNMEMNKVDPNWSNISTDDVRWHYNGKNDAGKDVWVVTDLGNVALPYGDGNLQTDFEANHQKLTPEKQNLSNTDKSRQYSARQQEIVAKNSVKFIDNGIMNFDPGMSPGDVNSTIELYDASWQMLSPDDRDAANNAYHAMFNSIKAANDKYEVNDDAMIHWYLFSSGYLQKGDGDSWKRPPGMINGS